MQQFIRFFILFFFSFSLAFSAQTSKVLSVEEAFKILFSQESEGIAIDVTLGEGIYLYDTKIKLEITQPKVVDITALVERPKAQIYHESLVQHNSFTLKIPFALLKEQHIDAKDVTFKLSYQGCSTQGICYQPLSQEFRFSTQNVSSSNSLSEQDHITQQLMQGDRAWVLLSFFGFGLLLSLTPCVFPMIPILSSIIVSQPNSNMSAKKGFMLSLVYVLAMACAYTIAGVLAALFGANLQASMQNPWVISFFSAIFLFLALSMFGFYELKMPSFIQNKVSKKTGEAQTQGIVGIAIMGFLSALIVGPCVAAPLAGALMYIGQSGDVLLGGSALFVMSVGMGTPLLMIGTTAGRYMPKPGVWMQRVSTLFGIMLLGVALWMLSRIIPASLNMVLWSLLLVGTAIYFGALESAKEGWEKLFKSFWLLCLVYGILIFVGFVSGATNPLRPLETLTSKSSVETSPSSPFTKVKSLEELNVALQASKKPVMLDFYADWCVNCVEFDQLTFKDERVKAKLAHFTLLKADVTYNTPEDKALQKAFNIYGPPAILFFKEGKEVHELRLVGFKNADEFLAHLDKLGV